MVITTVLKHNCLSSGRIRPGKWTVTTDFLSGCINTMYALPKNTAMSFESFWMGVGLSYQVQNKLHGRNPVLKLAHHYHTTKHIFYRADESTGFFFFYNCGQSFSNVGPTAVCVSCINTMYALPK